MIPTLACILNIDYYCTNTRSLCVPTSGVSVILPLLYGTALIRPPLPYQRVTTPETRQSCSAPLPLQQQQRSFPNGTCPGSKVVCYPANADREPCTNFILVHRDAPLLCSDDNRLVVICSFSGRVKILF